MKAIVVSIVLMVFLNACKHQKTDPVDQSPITIEEFACEGSCPVYSLTIYRDGKSDYKGINHVNVYGEDHYDYDQKDMDELFKMISGLDFANFEDLYDSLIADLPETVITYNGKRIVMKDIRNVPEDLKELTTAMQALARRTGFIN